MHNTNVKRESLETSGSNANNKICFEVRAPSSTSPPSPRRISNPLYSHQGNPTEEDLLQQWSTELLSQPPPYNRGVGPQPNNHNHLYRRGIQTPSSTSHKREQTPISTSIKEGANTSPINLYQRGIQQKQGCLQLRGLDNLKHFSFLFFTKQRS